MKKNIIGIVLFFLIVSPLSAQEVLPVEIVESTSTTTTSVEKTEVVNLVPLVLGEEIVSIKKIRNLERLSIVNFIPYTLFTIVDLGLPAETLVLILMIPLLTTLLVFVRNIVGLPGLDMLVIIAFSIALLASDLLIGLLLLFTILISSMVARVWLKRIKIMQLPKISLSMMIVSFAVLLMLSLLALSGLVSVDSVSIVPILLLIILSERIVRLEFERKPRQVWLIVISSLVIGIVGYFLLLSEVIRMIVLNFPELILLLIPINIVMGRYFGLRLTEYYRFSELLTTEKVNKKK